MKGIVLAVGFIAMSMGISMGLMFYISHEQFRLNLVMALKQSLSETMIELATLPMEQREAQAMDLFVDNFRVRKEPGSEVTIDLMGFMADPLALRIRITASHQQALFDQTITAEETMIEDGYENQ